MDNQEKIVVIVERDTGVANMIRAILGIVKVQVAHAQTGNHALEILAKNNPGLIICESHVPDMSGYELLKQVRQNPSTAQVPFIMIVPDGDTTHETLPKEKAADRYITKPFTRTQGAGCSKRIYSV